MSRRTRMGAAAAVAVAALASGAAPASQAATAPTIAQLVAFPDGKFSEANVKAGAATARVGRRRCAIGAATPLAALVRIEKTALLRDYGSCSRKAADAGGLYVRSIRKHRARGVNGWVYKVGNKLATAGAGDPAGPFGRGRLKSKARVTWFYCRMTRAGSCQHTLGIKAEPLGGGSVRVTVRAYDDRGRSKPAAGALVQSGDGGATTGDDGVATLSLPPGKALVHAEANGLVRSFEEAVDVR